MVGNSSRRGAVRRTKKGATAGSGGVRRRGLEGKGPTPKAQDRPNHKAYAAPGKGTGRPDGGRGRDREQQAGENQVAGRNAVLEALQENVPATALTLMHGLDTDERVREILRLAQSASLPISETSPAGPGPCDRARRAPGRGTDDPSLRVRGHRRTAADRAGPFEPPLLIALDQITDPRNLGAILRSAGAFGAHGVILPERRSVSMTASVWKVAAGAAGRVRVAQVKNLNRTLTDLKARGVFAVGLDADGDVSTRDLALGTEPVVLVVGAEGKGLSRLTRETCDQTASIPMGSSTESLNASVACAIALYEVAGTRRSTGLA
jgi:23S rRNA (guanosine2251-2'-O)-methyltransferase